MGETSKKERKIRNQIGTLFRTFPCAKIRTFSDMAKLFFGSRHDLFPHRDGRVPEKPCSICLILVARTCIV